MYYFLQLFGYKEEFLKTLTHNQTVTLYGVTLKYVFAKHLSSFSSEDSANLLTQLKTNSAAIPKFSVAIAKKLADIGKEFRKLFDKHHAT